MNKKIISCMLLLSLLSCLAYNEFCLKKNTGDMQIGVLTSTIYSPRSFLNIYNQDLKPIRRQKIAIGALGKESGAYSRTGNEIFLNIGATKYFHFQVNGMVSINCETGGVKKYPAMINEIGNRVSAEEVAANSYNIYTMASQLTGDITARSRQTGEKIGGWMPDFPMDERVGMIAANEKYVFVATDLRSDSMKEMRGANLYVLKASTLETIKKWNLSAYADRIGDNYLLTENSLYVEVSQEKPLMKREIDEIRAQYEKKIAEQESPDWLEPKLLTERGREGQKSTDQSSLVTTYPYFHIVQIEFNHLYHEKIDIGARGVGGMAEHGNQLLILSDDYQTDYLMVYDHKEKRKMNYGLPDLPKEICVVGNKGYLLCRTNSGFYLSELDLSQKPFQITKQRQLNIDLDQYSVGMYIYTK